MRPSHSSHSPWKPQRKWLFPHYPPHDDDFALLLLKPLCRSSDVIAFHQHGLGGYHRTQNDPHPNPDSITSAIATFRINNGNTSLLNRSDYVTCLI